MVFPVEVIPFDDVHSIILLMSFFFSIQFRYLLPNFLSEFSKAILKEEDLLNIIFYQ